MSDQIIVHLINGETVAMDLGYTMEAKDAKALTDEIGASFRKDGVPLMGVTENGTDVAVPVRSIAYVEVTHGRP